MRPLIYFWIALALALVSDPGNAQTPNPSTSADTDIIGFRWYARCRVISASVVMNQFGKDAFSADVDSNDGEMLLTINFYRDTDPFHSAAMLGGNNGVTGFFSHLGLMNTDNLRIQGSGPSLDSLQDGAIPTHISVSLFRTYKEDYEGQWIISTLEPSQSVAIVRNIRCTHDPNY